MAKKSNRRVIIVDRLIWPKSLDDNINWKLLKACTLRNVHIAREAVSQGADVNCRRSDFLTPLHIAVEHNDTELIQLLCDQPSIDIESRTMHGLTPLHEAALLGHTDAIEMLLENGAIVNCKDNLDRCPLHYATLQKDVQSSSILLKSDADVNVYDAFEETPLYTSIITRPSFPMIKLLLSYGATVHLPPDKLSLGLLLEAVLSMRNASDTNILDLLFKHGADVNTMDFVGLRTPLHIVAMTGNVKLANYLIEKGADLLRRNRAGQTPVEVALAFENFEVAQLIEDSFVRKLNIHRTSSVTSFIST